MKIADNGTGLDESRSDDEGIGLKTMRHRAKLIRAELDAENCAGEGFQVSVRLRIRDEEGY